MAISWDAHTTAAANYEATGTQNTTHAVGANARAAAVVITQINANTDQVSGVTFNGVAMSRPIAYKTNPDEAAAVYLYFLDDITGQGGNVTVAMTTTDNDTKRLSVHTFNTQGAEYSVDCVANSAGVASGANPTVTIAGLSTGKTYLGVMGVESSLNAFPDTIGANWTRNHWSDEGIEGYGHGYLTNTTTGVTSLTATWTAGTDGYAIIAGAFSEGARIQTATATNATVSVSTAAAPGGMAKPGTATATQAVTAAATAGGSVKPAVAQAVSVSPTPALAQTFLFTDERRTISGSDGKTFRTLTGRLGKPGSQTQTATASVTVSPSAAAAGAKAHAATATAVTVSPSALATPAGVVKPRTATGVTVSPTTAATPAAMTKSTTGTAVTVAPTTAATGVVTDVATAAATVSPTATASLGVVTKPGTASATQAVTATASGVVTDQATASATVGVSAAATPAAMVKTATAAATVTVSTTAVPQPIQDTGTGTATVAPSSTATGSTAKATTATGATVAPTADAVPAAIPRATTAIGVTVSPTATAAGIVTDAATADATVSPSAAAVPAVMTKSTTATAVTVAPAAASVVGAMAKPATATGVTVSPSTTAALSAVAKASMAADATVATSAAAAGEVWRSRFFRPDALLTLTGLSGTVSEIQDSPTSPNGDALDPTGGAVVVRFSFEEHGQQLRTGTGDQVIRVLATTP